MKLPSSNISTNSSGMLMEEAFGIGLISPFISVASNPDIDSLPSYLSKFANLINIDSGSELLIFMGFICH